MPIQENIQNFSLDTNTNSIMADQSSRPGQQEVPTRQNPNVADSNYLQDIGQQEDLTVQNPNVADSNYLQETGQQEDLTVQSPIQETEQNINQPNLIFQSETGQQILQPQQFQEQHQQHIPITTLPIDGSVDLIKQALCLSDIDLENESKYSNPSPAPPLVEVGLSIYLSTPAGMLPTPDVPAVSTKIKGQPVAQPAESSTGTLLIPVPDFDNIPSGSGRQRRPESDNTENEEVNLKHNKFGKCKAYKGKPYLKTGKPDKEADVYRIANELGIIIPVEDNKKKNDENFEKGFDDDNLNSNRGKSVTCEAIKSPDLVKNYIPTTGDLTPDLKDVMVSPGNPRPRPTERKEMREIVKRPAIKDETRIKLQAKLHNKLSHPSQSQVIPAAKIRNIPNLRTMLRDKPSQAPVTITRPVTQVPPNIPDFEKLGFKFEELF